MTNREYIQKLSDKELAEMLVYETETNYGDYDYDDNPIDWYLTEYITPDGEAFDNLKDAIRHTIEWLNTEV